MQHLEPGFLFRVAASLTVQEDRVDLLPGPPHRFVGADSLLDWPLVVDVGGGRNGVAAAQTQGGSLGSELQVLERGVLGGAGG